MRIQLLAFAILTAAVLGCSSSGQLGESWTWMKPCGTPAQLEADRQACLGQTAGVVDPSQPAGIEYGQDLFRQCMEARGWQRVPRGTVLECE